MTSRNLFFKLMKEDLKRRLWAIGFSVLALFFAMPMAAAMGIGEIGNQYKQWLISGTGYENMVPEALRQTKILRLAGEILGFENYALFMVVGAAAKCRMARRFRGSLQRRGLRRAGPDLRSGASV